MNVNTYRRTLASSLSPTSGRHVRLALLTLTALLISACAVGPDYKEPLTTMPASFQHAQTQAQTQTGDVAPPEAWWTGFHDPALTRIIERVQMQNLDLEVALARVTQARAAAHMAGANLLPKGEASVQTATERQSLQSPIGELARNSPGYERNTTLYDSGVGASWEIDLSGGLHRAQEAATADAQAVEAEQLGVRVTVEADAADAYFRVRGAQARIALAQEEIATDANLLEVVNLRLKEGMATRQEQAEAEARLAQIRASVSPLRYELDTQCNRLDVLMGAQPGTYAAELHASSVALIIPAFGGALQPSALLHRRPDVVAAERRLAASNARIGVATSAYYPQLSLSALVGFEGLNTASWSSSTFQPLAVTGLRWRLFDFGRVDAEVAQAKGANAEALARYRNSMLRATEEVEDALSAQTQFFAQRKELLLEIEADQHARQAADEAYKGGVTGIMELLEQDRQLLAGRDQLALVESGTARATVAAFRALGGGW